MEESFEYPLKPTRLIRSLLDEVGGAERGNSSRFLNPYQFDENAQQAMQGLFEQFGLGDDESRRVFLIAVEYELARLGPLVGKGPSRQQSRPRTSLPSGSIAGTATALADLLAGLDASAITTLGTALQARDRFQRGYSQPYFDAIVNELRALGMAAGELVAHTSPMPETNQDEHGEAAGRFVAMLADAYADCFESPAEASPGSPFVLLLETITGQARLPFQYPRPLIEAMIASVQD